MAYDEDLANRIREALAGEDGVVEKKMFGGLAFLIGGNMAVSASGQGGLLLRCDPAETDALGGQAARCRGSRCEGARWTAGCVSRPRPSGDQRDAGSVGGDRRGVRPLVAGEGLGGSLGARPGGAPSFILYSEGYTSEEETRWQAPSPRSQTTTSTPRCSRPTSPCSSTSGRPGAVPAASSPRSSRRSPSEREDLKIVKLDIDENPQTAARFQVLSIPTMILFKGGQPVKTVIGAYPKKKLEQELEPALAAA